jgi:antitoxin (DNA-binding transcriptional repressor) of toxin-antitoxin stability system
VDEIRLTLPGEPSFYPVVHLVLGGLGSRLELTVDGLDDLRLALDSLLERARRGSDVTIAVRLERDSLFAEVGPFEAGALEPELGEARAGELGLRRIFDTVVDGVDVRDSDGDVWVTLEKRLAD